jgi:hypothetical protein
MVKIFASLVDLLLAQFLQNNLPFPDSYIHTTRTHIACKNPRNNVTVDEERIRGGGSTFIAVELLGSIDHISDSSIEDVPRDRFAMDDPDDSETTDDLPFTSLGTVDISNIAEIPHIITINRLAQRKGDIKTRCGTALRLESLAAE